MASIFDGMAGVLNDVFGALVTVTPPGGSSLNVQGIFREEPAAVVLADGREDIVSLPTLSIQKGCAAIAVKWIVAPEIAAPRTFRVLRVLPPRSPAADALIICYLEEVI